MSISYALPTALDFFCTRAMDAMHLRIVNRAVNCWPGFFIAQSFLLQDVHLWRIEQDQLGSNADRLFEPARVID